jgi:hypothetical protein
MTEPGVCQLNGSRTNQTQDSGHLASVRHAVQDEDDHVEHQEDPHDHTILMVFRGLAAARAVVSTVRSSAHPFPAATLIAMETGSGSSWSSHTAALRSWPGAKWPLVCLPQPQ